MSADKEQLPDTKPRWRIPNHWEWLSLAEVGDIITGNTPLTKEADNYGAHIPFVKPPELTDRGVRSAADSLSEKGIKSARLVPKGAVLVSCIGGLGKTGLAKVAVAFNQQINAVVFDARVVPEFGFYYAQTLKPWLYEVSSATTLPIVNKAKFQRAPFPLAPIAEQHRIVAEIEKQFSRLDEAVVNLKRVKANLKRYKASVLKGAVEGKLTEEWRKQHPNVEPASKLLERILAERRTRWKGRGKYQEPAEPNTSNLPALPQGWTWATAAQLTPADRPCAYGVLQPGDHIEAGVPLVRVGDINDGRVDQSELKRIAPKIAARYPRTRLQGSEVVISLVGAIGRTAVIPQSLKGANTARAVGVISLTSEVSSHWVEIWFRNPAKVAELKAKSHEVARKTLNLEDVRDASVAIPPDKEQHQIVAEVERRLSVIEELEAAVEANLTRAGRLRQAILQRAFIGEL